MIETLKTREINGGRVIPQAGDGYQLAIPKGSGLEYRLAQLDNYMHLSRQKFPYSPPFEMKLQTRVSSEYVSGTWGFGVWNDPFSFGLGPAGMSKLLPVLPNAAWFFYGSKENFLSLGDDQPGNGFFMKTFRSPVLPGIFSLAAIPFLPLTLWKAAMRWVRKSARVLVKEAACKVAVNPCAWHTYQITWHKEQVIFYIDQHAIFTTNIAPKGKLGLVIWIDNQFMRFDPYGKIKFGFLPSESAQQLEIKDLEVC